MSEGCNLLWLAREQKRYLPQVLSSSTSSTSCSTCTCSECKLGTGGLQKLKNENKNFLKIQKVFLIKKCSQYFVIIVH